MKTRSLWLLPLILGALVFRGQASASVAEPGPEVSGVRLRLTVTPHAQDGKEGYDVQADLVSVSREAVALRAIQWRSGRHEGGFREYVESALSIESDPPIQPWLGQVAAPMTGVVEEPEYTLKPSETLSIQWHATGRHLKNAVSNLLEVQNPDFTERGLYSVHVSLVVAIAGRPARLRSNDQLVPIGDSREAPKHTYGPLWWTDEKTRTAELGLGALDKIVPGDRFLIQSGNIGLTWTLTLTNVQANLSIGSLEPVRENPAPAFPARGTYGALIPKQD
jgi:hypothetical protein